MKLGDIDVAVIGAGISGLTAAYYLQKAGRRVALFEAEPVPGGCIGSTAQGPYVADRGPQTFTTAEPLLELVRELNLDGAFTSADRAAARRYIFRHGRLNAMPTSLAGFLETPLLSTGAKCRLLMEPFVRRRIDVADESIAAFAQRRAGPDVVDALVAPIVSGIFAGDPARLSMQSTAPLLREIERRDGSVLVGSARRMRSGAVKRRAAGFIQGSRALVCAFARALGDALRTGVRVKRLSQKGASIALECEGLPESTIEARWVVVALPAPAAADLLALLEPDAAAALREIETPPMAQLALAYPRAAVGVPLDGFGFLACRQEGVRMLGAVWNSVVFPDRCPSDEVLVTAFFGGATDPDVANCSDEDLARTAHAELTRIMKINKGGAGSLGPAKIVAGFRWDAGIPQYTLGHAERVARIRRGLSRLPNVRLIGNFLRGASVSDCIRVAREETADL
ncbi:MAG TPA: protoporphyrinogen oxidase [Candidatus Tumulicola sp.]|nr:protoporphyrinogen oxidase [Candidatus Tumulicola sp.]